MPRVGGSLLSAPTKLPLLRFEFTKVHDLADVERGVRWWPAVVGKITGTEVAGCGFHGGLKWCAGSRWRCATDLLEARRIVKREGCAAEKMVAMEVARRGGCRRCRWCCRIVVMARRGGVDGGCRFPQGADARRDLMEEDGGAAIAADWWWPARRWRRWLPW